MKKIFLAAIFTILPFLIFAQIRITASDHGFYIGTSLYPKGSVLCVVKNDRMEVVSLYGYITQTQTSPIQASTFYSTYTREDGNPYLSINALIDWCDSFMLSDVLVSCSVAPITGNSGPMCMGPGNEVQLSCITPFGSWSVDPGTPPTKAIVNLSGLVAGISFGTAVVRYTVGLCSVTTTMTVNGVPEPINPISAYYCVSGTYTLNCLPAGGVWSSSDAGVASIGSTSGVMIGVSGGTFVISYTNNCGASGTPILPMTELPGAISGVNLLCVSPMCTNFSCTPPGGVWSSSNDLVASVGFLGCVNAVSGGSAIIYYTTDCGQSNFPVTVNPVPSPVPVSFDDPTCTAVFHMTDGVVTYEIWTDFVGVGTLFSSGLGNGGDLNLDYNWNGTNGVVGQMYAYNGFCRTYIGATDLTSCNP